MRTPLYAGLALNTLHRLVAAGLVSLEGKARRQQGAPPREAKSPQETAREKRRQRTWAKGRAGRTESRWDAASVTKGDIANRAQAGNPRHSQGAPYLTNP
jgi:hypothetical protein